MYDSNTAKACYLCHKLNDAKVDRNEKYNYSYYNGLFNYYLHIRVADPCHF
jgi:hypothetical protein